MLQPSRGGFLGALSFEDHMSNSFIPGLATVDTLRIVGEALYGDRWQTALAADLGVADRTMRRCIADAKPPYVEDRRHKRLLCGGYTGFRANSPRLCGGYHDAGSLPFRL